jgi:hypothetical protein
MNSIPIVLFCDTLRRGHWWLVSMSLVVGAITLFLLTALRATGPLNVDDPSFITMHIVLSQGNAWAFGTAIMSAQGPLASLYTRPVAASTIVVWRLLPLLVLSTLQSVLNTAAINYLFGTDWPLWGPALFLGAVVTVAQAMAWWGEKSAWSVVALGLFALFVGYWYQLHYGGFTRPTHFWYVVSAADVAVVLALIALAYGLGVNGVARNRRGEPPWSLGILAWLERTLDFGPGRGGPFRSPDDAQLWLEWWRRGWAMPVCVAVIVAAGFIGWLIFSRKPEDLWIGLRDGGAVLFVVGLIGGLIQGNVGPRDSNYEMGGFLGTRPLTSVAMARTILKVCAVSVMLAWSIWAVSIATSYLVLSLTHAAPQELMPREWGWWYFPATLLGPWVVAATVVAIGLTGRSHPFAELAVAIVTTWIGTTLLAKFTLSAAQQALVQQGLIVIAGILCLAVTLWAFVLAKRRGLIGWPTLYAATTIWLALGAASLSSEQLSVLRAPAFGLFVLGILALAVAPAATAPLALAWNRNR